MYIVTQIGEKVNTTFCGCEDTFSKKESTGGRKPPALCAGGTDLFQEQFNNGNKHRRLDNGQAQHDHVVARRLSLAEMLYLFLEQQLAVQNSTLSEIYKKIYEDLGVQKEGGILSQEKIDEILGIEPEPPKPLIETTAFPDISFGDTTSYDLHTLLGCGYNALVQELDEIITELINNGYDKDALN